MSATNLYQAIDNRHFKNSAWKVFRGGDGTDGYDSLSNILANQRARLRGVVAASRLPIGVQPANAETVTVGAHIFEWSNVTPPVATVGTRTAVYNGGAGGVAEARANLVKAINGTVAATKVTPGTAAAPLVVADEVVAGVIRVRRSNVRGGTPLPCAPGSIPLAETMGAGGNGPWDLLNLNVGGGKALVDQDVSVGQVAITAEMIAAGAFYIELPFTPTILEWEAYTGNSPIGTTDTVQISVNAAKINLAGGAAPALQVADIIKFTATA